MNKKIIGQRLKDLRGSRTIDEVAKLLGVSKSSVCMYELGERIPRDPIKEKYAEIFGVSIESIFFANIVHFECTSEQGEP